MAAPFNGAVRATVDASPDVRPIPDVGCEMEIEDLVDRTVTLVRD